jgi:outer membrane protein TolC
MNRQCGSAHGRCSLRKEYCATTFLVLAGLTLSVTGASAQQPPQSPQQPTSLTLHQAVAQAVQRSRDVAAARLRYEAAQRETAVSKSQFTPNVVAGSGVAYTNGFPLAAGGGAPALASVTYNQTLLDPMARSDVRAAQQREEQMRVAFDGTRDAVITRVASAYLELAKVRRSRELLLSERASAARILEYIRQRVDAGLELPIEVTRAQLTAAKIEQAIARQENGADSLSEQLRADLGIASDQPMQVATEDLPPFAEPDAAFLERAVENSTDVKQAAAERQTSLVRLQGEQGSRWPTLSVIGQYNVLAKFNNYDQFFNKFQRNNVLAGVQLRIPIFVSRSTPGIAAAQAGFNAAQTAFDAKRSEVSLDVRQKMRQRRENDAAREVARLELELAQQNTAVVQSQFNQGRATLRDLEAAQLEQNDKWLAFLDADFARQQAQLALMKATGQVAQLAR